MLGCTPICLRKFDTCFTSSLKNKKLRRPELSAFRRAADTVDCEFSSHNDRKPGDEVGMIVLSHAFSISGFALGGASYDCRLVATSEYDTASDTFRPGNESDSPPQEHDAKCGFACTR